MQIKTLRLNGCGRALLLAVALTSIAGATAQVVTWDLAQDYSYPNNPNGAWSYVDSSYGLLSPGTSQVGLGGPAFNGFYPLSVCKATAGYGWVPGDIVVHTSNANDPTFGYRWTSPISGIVDVTGAVWYAHGGVPRSDNWAVTLRGTSLTAGVIGYDTPYVSRANSLDLANGSGGPSALQGLAVSPGDEIELCLWKTSESDAGSFVGANLTITVVPEPAACAGAVALGLVGFVIHRRRLSKS